MPFISISFGERMLDQEAFIEQYSFPRVELVREVEFGTASSLTCVMPDVSLNVVTPSDFNVRVRHVNIAEGERQAKDVEIMIAAVGYPDRMNNRHDRADTIREYMEGNFPGITFGVWLDLKPYAVWSE